MGANFHGEMDSYLQAESRKLESSEARGDRAKKSLRESGAPVCDFVRDHAPKIYKDLGQDPVGEGFASRVLPHFLDMIDEDRHILQKIGTTLNIFTERRFPDNEELLALKSDPSPLPLLRAV